jgi:hypothetical protein
MEIFNPFDAEKWRGVIADFDAKRRDFYATVTRLQQPAPTPALEARRQQLLSRATGLDREMNTVMNGLRVVRDALRNLGQFFGLGAMGQPLNGLGAAPILVGMGIAAVVAVIALVTSWLKDAGRYESDRLAEQLRLAGASQEEITAALQNVKTQPKLFGMDMGALKWVAIIAGIAIAGPFVVKEIQKRV